jgi:hypothetical protein
MSGKPVMRRYKITQKKDKVIMNSSNGHDVIIVPIGMPKDEEKPEDTKGLESPEEPSKPDKESE